MALKKEEKEEIMKLALSGMNPRDIAKKVGKTEITVTRCLSKAVVAAFKDGGGNAGGEDAKLADSSGGGITIREGGEIISLKGMENVDALTQVTISSPQHAAQIGQMTGTNLITMFNQAVRVLGGRARPGEKKTFLADLVGIVFGGMEGNESYARVMPDEIKARQPADITALVASEVERQTAQNMKTIIKELKDAGAFK